ncbi:MAG: hypothetical protein QOI15_1945 [Pseudonocardiales bacterium]|nr:hypothetical protein [Pseudonocardiales bacterium]
MRWILRRVRVIGLPILLGALIVTLTLNEAPGAAHSSAASPPRNRAATPAPAPGTAVRPNILFVLTDDLTSNLLRYMPNVQRMRQQGVSFSKYFVVDSQCCPSRAAILTGRYPHNTGVFRNTGSNGGYRAFNAHHNAARTYGLALQHAGYATGFMGKYLNGYQPNDGVPRGWDEWDVAGGGYREYGYQLNENGAVRYQGYRPRAYLTDVLSRKASAFITRNAGRERPFALEIAPFSPHLPATAAPRDVDRYRSASAPRGPAWNRLPTRAPRWLASLPALSRESGRAIRTVYRHRAEAVLSVDRMIGHLRRLLDGLGIADNTYVVFSSDNGFHLGQYRLRPGKLTAFDADIRVPLVVTGPGVPAARTISAMTTSIDLAPTFARIGHTALPAAADGRSMLRLWHGRVPRTWPRAVLVEHYGKPLRIGDPDYQRRGSGRPPTYEAIRTANALYVEYVDGEREYYDLRTDPFELHNTVSTTPPTALARLRTALHRLTGCSGATACRSAARVG